MGSEGALKNISARAPMPQADMGETSDGRWHGEGSRLYLLGRTAKQKWNIISLGLASYGRD